MLDATNLGILQDSVHSRTEILVISNITQVVAFDKVRNVLHAEEEMPSKNTKAQRSTFSQGESTKIMNNG